MRSAVAFILAGALSAGGSLAQEPAAAGAPGGPVPPAPLVDEAPPAGHVEVMLSGSAGAAPDGGALARYLPVLHAAGFLDSSSRSTADPLAPCALLSAVVASASMNYIFCGLGNPACDLKLPAGTHILGRYDQDIAAAKGAVPHADPLKAADIVARVVIWRSWGSSTNLNSLIAPMSQRQCLALLVDPPRLGQALSRRSSDVVLSHGAPVSAYITSVTREAGNEWLAALPRPEMPGMPSASAGNPLMPCELLSAFRLAARVNDAWGNRLPAGKLETEGRPELAPYAEDLKKPLGSGGVNEKTAELLAAGLAAEMARANWLSAQLTGKATQGECLAEFFQPGTLRARLLGAGVTLPTR